MDLLKDETGSWSSARCAFWLVTIFALVVIAWDAASPAFTVPEPGYTLLGAIFGVVGVWAAGPRIASYLGPQLGAIVQGIGASKRSPEPERPEPDAETMTRRG